MPAAKRLGDICTGHGCWPPRPNVEASPNVFVNGIAAHREGDAWDIHCCDASCHSSVLATGSSTVFINGKPAARIGDPVACGSLVAQGSSDTFIGG
jgi:uncharacterized Zn-binding protein involved in type VI secretion